MATLLFQPCIDNEGTFLSNFHPYTCTGVPTGKPLVVSERFGSFLSVEHAYHFFRYLWIDADYARDVLRHAPTPKECKRLAQKGVYAEYARRKVDVERHYEKAAPSDEVLVGIMRALLNRKFRQNPDLGARLVATGHRPLAERGRHPNDFWRHTGQNMLGRLLMELRTTLRKESEACMTGECVHSS